MKKGAASYVATVHSCWGILNSAETGQGLGQLVLGQPEGAAAQLLWPFAPLLPWAVSPV